MKSGFNSLLLLLLTGTLLSCTSQLKKGQNLLADRNFEEALPLFEDLLAKEPKNEEAQVGLRKAREGVLDKNLIKVRLLRMGNNVPESLELLKTILEQQNHWQVFPTGAVAFTQKEELSSAFSNLKREIRAALDQQRTFKANYFLQRYQILVDERQKSELTTLSAEANTQGQKLCKEQRKTQSSEVPFWSIFVDKVCSFYNVKLGPKEKSGVWKRGLYKEISAQWSQKNIALEKPERVIDALNKGFFATAWYDGESTERLQSQLQAEFKFSHTQSPKQLVHFYQVQIPYTVYTTETVVNAATGVPENKSVPRTENRSEQRSFYYPATEHDLKTSFDATADITGVGTTSGFGKSIESLNNVSVRYSKSETGHGIESETENLNVGLQRQYPINIHPSSFFYENFLASFSSEIKNKLIAKYIELFCNPISSANSEITKADLSLRCLRQTKSAPHAAATQWSQSQWGLNPQQLDEVLNY